MAGPLRRVSDTQRRKIELADQELAESTSITDLMNECKNQFGLASKIMAEVKRGKFKKIDSGPNCPKD
jgi:hypothetical protein